MGDDDDDDDVVLCLRGHAYVHFFYLLLPLSVHRSVLDKGDTDTISMLAVWNFCESFQIAFLLHSSVLDFIIIVQI